MAKRRNLHSNRKILAVISDTHGGLKVALMNPATVLFAEDENGNLQPYQPSLNAQQVYIWRTYTAQIQQLRDIADSSPIVAFHLGDECNGNKYPQMLVSDRISDQITIADYNARPMLELPGMTAYRQVIGTQAHNFGQGSSAHLLVQILQARYPKLDIKPEYHGLVDVGGTTHDIAHHGPYPGSRDWLKGNVARFYLRDLMIREIKHGRRPPDMVHRGHYHTPVHEVLEDTGFTSELYVYPSFSMFTDHSMQATMSQNEITHGFNVFEIEDGKITARHMLHATLDVRTVEKL